MSDALLGQWQIQETDDNFVDYLRAVGVAEENIEVAKRLMYSKLYQEILRDGNVWTIKIQTTAGTRVREYTEGQPVNDPSMDHREATVVYTVDGDKLVETVTYKANGIISVNTREVVGEKMKETYTTGNITSVRTFKRRPTVTMSS